MKNPEPLNGIFPELKAALIQSNDAERSLRENRLLDCEKSIRAIRVHLIESLTTAEQLQQQLERNRQTRDDSLADDRKY